MGEKISYVYRHRRLDTNEVFYIGLGKTKYFKRAYSKNDRNNYWHNIVNKHGFSVEVVQEGLTKEEACELESFLILLYGRIDNKTGILVNLTDGGDGTANILVSEEQRKKRSIAYRGKNNPFYGKKHSIKSIQEIKDKQTGKRASQETVDKMKESRYKYLASDDVFIYPRNGELNPKAKLVLCYETGVFYLTAKEAANAYGIKYTTLKSFLQGRRLNKTSLAYC